MKRYRYYSSSLSRHMVPALNKHLPKIGCPTEVRAICHGGRPSDPGWYELVVTGMLGKLVLRGCSWGYGGEGPHATRDVLTALGVRSYEANELAFQTPNHDVGISATKRVGDHFAPAVKGKVYFKRALLPVLPPFTAYSVVDGKVVVA